MKHATAAALDQLEPLLGELRSVAGLKEKSRGIFYRKSRAFLHFHEDHEGLFADIRNEAGDDFDRLNISSATARAELLALARARA